MTYDDCKDGKCCKTMDDFAISKLKHSKPQEILLECGSGTGSRIFTSADDAPFQLANVTIDTAFLKKAEVLIKFSSLVKVERAEDEPKTVRLQYKLFRECNGEEPIPLGTWMFKEADSFQDEDRLDLLQESFNFNLCESSVCLGCCTYFVTVTPLEITNAAATVSNGQMAALVQPLNCIVKDNYKTFHSCCDKEIMFKPKLNDIILSCGQENGGIVFKGTGLQLAADIANVTVDTSFLINPKVFIDFSCTIKIDINIDCILQFELFRVCGDSKPISLNTWKFKATNKDNILIGQAFGFIFCEEITLSQCCKYFIRVTPVSVISEVDVTITVDGARITALAQSSKETINYDNFKKYNEKSGHSVCKSKPQKILLECGNGSGSKTFTSASDVPFTLANVSIDTTHLHNPIVNIEFSSIVSFVLTGDDIGIQLRYELFRSCDNRSTISVGVWELFRAINAERTIEKTETFNFTFCEYLLCPGCCDYFVTVTAIEVVPGVTTVATAQDSRIAALAQES